MFKKLKSIFIVEDENAEVKSSTQQQKPEVKTESKPASEVKFEKPVYDKANPPKGKLDEKFVNRLLGAIEDNNIEGFDYLEYKQALQNLSKVEMDEKTKFQSALAVAKTMGANKEVLVSSAEHYLNILEKEELKFVDAFKNQMSRQVTKRSDDIRAMEAEIENMKAQIKELEQKIEQKREALKKSMSSVDQAKSKVELTKERFYQAYHIVAEQIRDDLEKIKEYLS